MVKAVRKDGFFILLKIFCNDLSQYHDIFYSWKD